MKGAIAAMIHAAAAGVDRTRLAGRIGTGGTAGGVPYRCVQVPVRHRPDDFDTDQDGMPDAFERLHGLNSEDPADRNGHELDANGYTNLEIYLHELTLTSDKPEIH